MSLTRKTASLLAAAALASAQLLTVGAANPVAAAGTIRVDVCIQGSGGGALVPGTTYYKIGSQQFFADTVDGSTKCKYQDFPDTTTALEVWTTYNGSTSPHLTQNIQSDPRFDFHTNRLTLELLTAGGAPLAGGKPRWGKGTTYSTRWFPVNPGELTDANGTVSAQVFPGTYSFEMLYQSTAQAKISVNVPDADKKVTWRTATVTLSWPNQIAYGGSGDGRLFDKPTMNLLAGTYRFHFRDPDGCYKDLTWGSGANYTDAGCFVPYDFAGFFQPVDNNAKNVVKAGSAIPVKFSLGGNEGLDIFDDGFPKSFKIDCDTGEDPDPIEQTVTSGGSSLSYDPDSARYTYVWKTQKAWAGTCRRFKLGLDDGSNRTFDVKFK